MNEQDFTGLLESIVGRERAAVVVDALRGYCINIPKKAIPNPQDDYEARDLAIYEAFNGRNHSELAEVFGLSIRAAYAAIKRGEQIVKRAQKDAQHEPANLEKLLQSIDHLMRLANHNAACALENDRQLRDLSARIERLQS